MFKKGVTVLVPFPFTDLSGTKVRPAVVISQGVVGDDVTVLFVSSKKTERRHLFDVEILPDKINGIKQASVAKCSKIATLDRKIILGELGRLSPEVVRLINGKLRLLLTL